MLKEQMWTCLGRSMEGTGPRSAVRREHQVLEHARAVTPNLRLLFGTQGLAPRGLWLEQRHGCGSQMGIHFGTLVDGTKD